MFLGLGLLWLGQLGLAQAGPSLRLDPEFAPTFTTAAPISSVTPLADGRVILFSFNADEMNGQPIGRLFRIDSRGAVDPTFQFSQDTKNTFLSVFPFEDGQLLVYRNSSGFSQRGILRLKADGSIDPAFTAPAHLLDGGDSAVLAVDSSKRVYVLTNPSFPITTLVRLSATGAIDASFQCTLPSVSAVVPQPDGRVLVTNTPTSVSGNDRRLARLNADGTFDTSFAFFSSPKLWLGSPRVLVNGQILARSSDLSEVPSVVRLVRFSADGTQDGSFALADAATFDVFDFAVLADGRIISSLNRRAPTSAQRRNTLCRFRADGSLEYEYGGALPLDVSLSMTAITSDGTVVVQPSPQTAPLMFRLDGSIVADFFPRVVALADFASFPLRDGRLIVAGNYDTINGTAWTGVARLARDGALDNRFRVTGAGASNLVYGPPFIMIDAVQEQSDGSIVCHVLDTSLLLAHGPLKYFVYRVKPDGTMDAAFNARIAVHALTQFTVMPDDSLIASGTFALPGGGTATRVLVRLNADGSFNRILPPAFATGAGIALSSIVQPGGRLFLFLSSTEVVLNQPVGSAQRGAIRLNTDGTIDQSFALTATEAVGSPLFVFPDGSGLIARGSFSQGKLLRIGASGAPVSGFQTTVTPAIYSPLLPRADGSVVYCSDQVSNDQSSSIHLRLLRPDGSPDPSVDLTLSPGDFPTLADVGNGTVLLMGSFATVGGTRRHHLARLRPDPASVFFTQPRDETTVAGRDVNLGVTLTLDATASYQWRRDGEVVAGATGATLEMPNIATGQAGRYDVAVTTGGNTYNSTSATVAVVPNTACLVNISSLAYVGPDTAQAVTGFVLRETTTRPIMVRGVGPGLAGLNVGSPLASTQLQLFRAQTLLAENRQWGGGATLRDAFSRVGAFALPADSADAALLATISPGDYTALLAPGDGVSRGYGLIEFYDLADDGSRAIFNVSARGEVGRGGTPLTAGFVVRGQGPTRVLIRGIGPGLRPLGVDAALPDPFIKLYAQNALGAPYTSNDNWSDDASDATSIASTTQQVGAFSLAKGSRDAALLVRLEPGAYTVQLSGADASTGISLVEVYVVGN